jgi:hypothetical protein
VNIEEERTWVAHTWRWKGPWLRATRPGDVDPVEYRLHLHHDTDTCNEKSQFPEPRGAEEEEESEWGAQDPAIITAIHRAEPVPRQRAATITIRCVSDFVSHDRHLVLVCCPYNQAIPLLKVGDWAFVWVTFSAAGITEKYDDEEEEEAEESQAPAEPAEHSTDHSQRKDGGASELGVVSWTEAEAEAEEAEGDTQAEAAQPEVSEAQLVSGAVL